jgi:radical SAM superfamily enzyme YgiQ (UPF0313 family)
MSGGTTYPTPSRHKPPRILLVDLNNFSLYPTMAVGYLTAILRQSGFDVTVLSPLAYGIPGVMREPPESVFLNLARRLNFALTQIPGAAPGLAKRMIDLVRSGLVARRYPRIREIFADTSPERFDAVLVSAYLMYYPVCVEIGRLCAAHKLPLLIGGSYFAAQEVAESWLDIPGLRALVAGEVEAELPELVQEAIAGGDLSRFPGVFVPGRNGAARPPLLDLDRVPYADYSDFPWHKYPHRLIPLLAGRGCGWGVCNFCSDVTSSSGRTFRTRTPENLLGEVRHQGRRHGTNLFVFTDLKLNSDLPMWEAICSRMPEAIDYPQWIASVHVGSRQPNGLDAETLKRAKQSGLVRLTTGLESGSQRVLDSLVKGTDLETSSRFLRDASAAGISVRVTMIHGAPGETAEDVSDSADYLATHVECIDRVKLNRFMIMLGTAFQRRYDERPSRYPTVISGKRHLRLKYVDYRMTNTYSMEYFKATQKLLGVVHRINKKRLSETARVFEGVL